jgi:hypothetical protein
MTETKVLTADDVTALRTADQFTISINRNAPDLTELHCIKKMPGKRTGPFSSEATELRCTIETASRQTGVVAWFHVYGNPGGMKAIAMLARPGDRLYVRAYNNNNEYVTNAGLFHDECSIAIIRTNSRGRDKTIVDLVVADSICPNNSARAIQAT